MIPPKLPIKIERVTTNEYGALFVGITSNNEYLIYVNDQFKEGTVEYDAILAHEMSHINSGANLCHSKRKFLKHKRMGHRKFVNISMEDEFKAYRAQMKVLLPREEEITHPVFKRKLEAYKCLSKKGFEMWLTKHIRVCGMSMKDFIKFGYYKCLPSLEQMWANR